MLRKFLFSCCALMALTACGGGSGGGASSVVPGGPASLPTTAPSPKVYATLAPPSAQQNDIKTLATGGGAAGIAYWPDNNVVAVAGVWTVVNAGDGSVLATPPDGNQLTAITYAAAAHSIVFATQRNIYALDIYGSLTTIATHFNSISALAAVPDGTIYAIETDHIVKIHNGVTSDFTAPGSVARDPYVNASLATSPDGSLWLADPYNNVIDRVTASGSLVPFVGSCKPGPTAATGRPGSCWQIPIAGMGSAANFCAPSAIAYDSVNNTLYVADEWGQDLWAVSASGAASPVAGYGAPLNEDGNGLRALLNYPFALTFQASTNSVDILENFGFEHEIVAYSVSGTPAPPYTSPALTTYVPSGLAYNSLAAMTDGSAWSDDAAGKNVVRVSPTGALTMYPTAGITTAGQVAIDRSDNAWYTAAHVDSEYNPIDMGLLKVTPSGEQTYFKASPNHTGGAMQSLYWLAIGPDGNPWFTENDIVPNGGSFGFVNQSTGTVTQYTLNTSTQASIASVPNGVAFLTNAGNSIQFASLSGQLGTTERTTSAMPFSLLYRASDSSFWFTSGSSTISSVDASGSQHDYTVCSDCTPTFLTIGSDGSIWADVGNIESAVVRITPSGTALLYYMPLGINITIAISARSDGKLWVYNNAGALFLFDPAAYDAMNGPHVAPYLRTTTATDSQRPWRKDSR